MSDLKTVVVLTDEETADGFRLSGVETLTAEDAGEAIGKLNGLLSQEEIGIIALNEEWMQAVDEPTRERIERMYRPIVVSIPKAVTRVGAEDRRARLARIIRRAVGFEIKTGER